METGSLLEVCWRQWRTERALARRGVRFRTTDPVAVESAYAAMSDVEFEAINGRQAWANGRTIPRALAGRLPARPVLAVDLGCGTGPSTRVLASCIPPGSRVIGYELAAPLAKVAGTRTYRGPDGKPADVTFVCQGVTEPLIDPQGKQLAAASVDVANASGVVGHHLTELTVGGLVSELARVIAAGGFALLDVGPTLRDEALTHHMAPAGFERLGRFRSWWLDPTGQVLYRKR
jgi:SAM-dependent methyltransferase